MIGYFRYRPSMARLAQLVAICALTSQVLGATPANWRMDIRRMPESNGDVSYEVDFTGLLRQVVHLPNGTAITPTSGIDATYNSFNALKSSFVGDWTIEIPALGTFIPQELYTFQMSDFPESLLYTIPPVITSPTDGSLVPADFTMTWAWPVGVTPPPSRSELIRRSGPGIAASSSVHSHSPADYLSAAESMRHGSGTIADKAIVRAGDWNVDTLVPYMSAVTPQQANSAYNISLRSFFNSYSTPITVYSVPEPAGICLLLGGLVAVICSASQRGRRNQ